MKKVKITILFFLLSFISVNVFSQGVFVQFHAGYNLRLGGTAFEFENFDPYNYTSGANSRTYESIGAISAGKGINIGGSIGSMFSENVGAELGIEYLIGGKTETTTSQTNYSDKTTIWGTMLRFNPMIIISAGSGNLSPYAKMGIIAGMGKAKFEYNENDDGDLEVIKGEASGGISIGFNAALGIEKSINDNMVFFAELHMVNMNYTPKKGELTEYTENGVDVLPNLTTNDKETEYVKEYTLSNTTPVPDSQPDQDLKAYIPFGSIGVNVGIKINL